MEVESIKSDICEHTLLEVKRPKSGFDSWDKNKKIENLMAGPLDGDEYNKNTDDKMSIDEINSHDSSTQNSLCQKDSLDQNISDDSDYIDMSIVKPIDNVKYSIINITSYIGEEEVIPSTNVNVPALLDEINKVTTKNYKMETILYSNLSIYYREKLSKHCIKMIKKRTGENGFIKLFKYIKSFIEKPREKPKVSSFILNVIMEIRRRCLHKLGIFRISGNRDYFTDIPIGLQTKNYIDLSKYDHHDLCSIFKSYIRNVLNGLIPDCVFHTLSRAFIKNRTDLIEYTKKYLPFCLRGGYRGLLLETLKLLIEVDSYSSYNKMTLINLLRIFPPTMFSEEATTDFSVIETQSKILAIMLELDYESIPLSLLQEALA